MNSDKIYRIQPPDLHDKPGRLRWLRRGPGGSHRVAGTVPLTVTADNAIQTPSVGVDEGLGTFRFSIEPADESRYTLIVIGEAGGATHTLAMDYEIGEDKTVLTYGVASRNVGY